MAGMTLDARGARPVDGTVDLSVAIGSVRLANPVMPASGAIAEAMARVSDLSALGAVVLKTITPDLREGVLPPRVAEFADATLFSIGIPSKGPAHLVDATIPFYDGFGPPLVASISADTAEDHVPEGEARVVTVDGRRLCVIDAPDGWFALDELCNHGQAFLSEGYCDTGDCQIECPLHGGLFDYRDGSPRATRWTSRCAPTRCASPTARSRSRFERAPRVQDRPDRGDRRRRRHRHAGRPPVRLGGLRRHRDHP